MGWSGTKNGALLNLAEGQFDVFITTDKNLRYQQNLSGRQLAFILLPSNQAPIVAALALALEQAIRTIKPGDFIEIPLPQFSYASCNYTQTKNLPHSSRAAKS